MAMTKKDFIEKMDTALSNVGEKVLRKSVTNFSYYYNKGSVGFETKSGRSLSYDSWSGVIKDIDIWNSVNRSHFTVSPDEVDQPTWIKICAEAHEAADKASFVAKC